MNIYLIEYKNKDGVKQFKLTADKDGMEAALAKWKEANTNYSGLTIHSSQLDSTFDDGETVEIFGYRFQVNFEQDIDAEAPWDQGDGEGIVSDWTTRDKLPGERVLSTERSSKRYYNIQGTITQAKSEGWGLGDYELAKLTKKLGREPTKGEICAQAVEQNYEHYRRWCNNQWHYCGVIVTPMGDEEGPIKPDYQYAFWGIEDDDRKYLGEMVTEVLYEALSTIFDERNEAEQEKFDVAYWASRDICTVGQHYWTGYYAP